MKTRKAQKGFTLVEMSIVLVIIGLIVGGVLTGQDLIAAAKNRAVVAQIQEYDTAANAFLLKYNGIPGDLKTAEAMFGASPIVDDGDGDGLIEGVTGQGPATATLYDYEIGNVWAQLSQAGMTTKKYVVAATDVDDTMAPIAKTGQGFLGMMYMPNGDRTVGGHYLVIGSGDGLGAVGAINDAGGAGFFAAVGKGGVTPLIALSIDSKLDDGDGRTGSTVAVLNAAGAHAADDTCTLLTTDGTYNVLVNELNCNLAVKMSGI